MRYLLDTNILVWLIAERTRLRSALLDELANPETEVAYSVVCLWEIGIKRSIDRMRFEPHHIASAATMAGLSMMGVTAEHCQAVSTLAFPAGHKDPFDRLLVSQAQVEGLTLLTSDAVLGQYGRHVRVV